MKALLPTLLSCLLISCTTDTALTQQDKQAIDQIRNDYVNGWLANDSETVLGLFTEDATIIPSGMSPINGIDGIGNYWFPNDSSTTTIHLYEIELLEIEGSSGMAYTLEKGILNFTYAKGDFSMSKESISHATTVYQKDASGDWKIISRMWSQVN